MNRKAVIQQYVGRHTLAQIKLVIMSILFGGSFIAGRVIGGEVPPPLTALLRFMVASTCLLGILYWQYGRFPIPDKKEIAGLLLLGLFGILGYNLFLLQALETVEAGRTAAVIASSPIFMTLLSCVFFKEHLTPVKIVGILLSVSGAVIVASKGDIDILLNVSGGDKALLGALVCWILYSVLGKQVLISLSPLISVTYSAVAGTLMLIPVALCTTDFSQVWEFTLSAWLSVVYLAIPGTVCAFLLFYRGIKDLGVVQAGVFINLIPISTLILSAPILGEVPGLSLLAGTALVVTGVLLVNRGKQCTPT